MQEGCIMLFTYYSFFFVLPERKRSVELCKRENDIFKAKISCLFKLLKPHFIGRILSNLKSISKYQLLLHWKSFENIWSFILYSVEAGETELINTCVVPTAELGQKCLEAASTLKYEPLNSLSLIHIWRCRRRG